MHSSQVHKVKFSLFMMLAIAVIALFCLPASAGDKKGGGGGGSHPAPASHPSGGGGHPSGGGGGAHPGGGGGGARTTSSGMSHGPTTSGGSHGPTTGNPGGRTTASGGSHGPTTSNPGGARTTTSGGARTTTTGGAGRTNTAGGTGRTNTSAAGGNRAGSSGGNRGGANARNVSSTGGNHGAGGGNKTATGRPAASGMHTASAKNGSAVTRRANGKTADVHDAKRNMDIHHGLNGGRTVSARRADGSRVVATRGGHGYVERGYHYHGRDYNRRAGYYHGRYYNSYYRGYYYGGYYMNAYAPAYYYGPAFYGWAYNPWPAPIYYSWGWNAAPWYGWYGGYFNPYPVYPSAAFWLTDYLVSQSLAAAYQANVDAQVAAAQAAQVPPSSAPAMTPEVKQMIADEVKRQIALENSEAQQTQKGQDVDPASSGIARMLSDNQTHVFIAGADLDVVQTSGQECAISQGDVLEVTAAPAQGAATATATVLCSKGGKECGKASQVNVAFTDLQEMQNHMRETIDQGMGDLQAKQGQSGIPAAPASAKAAPTKSPYVDAAPPPEKDVDTAIKQESAQADQAETEVAKEVTPDNPADAAAAGGSSTPVSISEGQTVDQVTAALGNPKSVVDLGNKKIYVYPDMKVTFKGGKVTDVQ